MANDIEIRVTGTDKSGPALAAAARNTRSLRDEITRADTSIRDASNGSRILAREITQVGSSVRNLAAELDRAERSTILGGAGKRKPLRAKDLLPGDDDTRNTSIGFGRRLAEGVAKGVSRAGGPIADALSGVLGTLPPQAQAAIGAGLVAVATAAAPLIGATISAAVVGGAGVGGIIGGVAIAAKHPQVQAAAKATGDTYSQELRRAAVSFVPATVESLRIVRSQAAGIGDELERASTALSPHLPALTADVLAGAKRAAEGFATAAERSGPVLSVLGGIARRAGDTIADTFEGLSKHAEAGAHALSVAWLMIEGNIRAVASALELLTAAYEKIEAGNPLLAWLGNLTAGGDQAQESSTSLADSLRGLSNGFSGVESSAAGAAFEVRSFTDSIRTFVDDTLGARAASRGLEAAIDAATEAVKENGRTLDENTPKGRANAAALDDIVAKGWAAYESTKQLTGSQEQAEEKLVRARAGFIRLAQAMGKSSVEAEQLADQLLALPPKADVTVNVLTSKATGAIVGFEKRVESLDGRVITVRTRITSAGEYIPGVGTQTRAHGGLTAASGGIRGSMTLVGEQGPELLELPPSTMVHPAGTTQRMLSGGAGGQVEVVLSFAPGTDSGLMREFVKSLRYEVRDLGGNVQLALGT